MRPNNEERPEEGRKITTPQEQKEQLKRNAREPRQNNTAKT